MDMRSFELFYFAGYRREGCKIYYLQRVNNDFIIGFPQYTMGMPLL